MTGADAAGVCALCRRAVVHTTRHHLIPRALHGRRRFRRLYSKEYMVSNVLWLCRPCHSFIHRVIPESELAMHYNTRDKLMFESTTVPLT